MYLGCQVSSYSLDMFFEIQLHFELEFVDKVSPRDAVFSTLEMIFKTLFHLELDLADNVPLPWLSSMNSRS